MFDWTVGSGRGADQVVEQHVVINFKVYFIETD